MAASAGAITRAPAAGLAAVARARRAGGARTRRVSIVLAAATALVVCVSVGVGDYPIALLDVPGALLGAGDAATVTVAQELRLPRALNGLMAGAALGLAGAIFQAVGRNPLASPDVLGVTHGSAAVVVLVLTTVGGSFALLYGGALAGALGDGRADLRARLPRRRVPVPVRAGRDQPRADGVVDHLHGDLARRHQLGRAGDGLAHRQPELRGLADRRAHGRDRARARGRDARRSRTGCARCSSATRAAAGSGWTSSARGWRCWRPRWCLAGAATAAAGPLPFVAFMAAPIARRLTRTPLTLLPAALTGAVLLLAADVVARRVFAPVEIPVGVVTGIAGAPYLLWLLARANKVGSGG